MHYQFTLLCISLFCAACILLLLRKSLLYPLHAVWWLGVAAIILLAGVFPRSFDAVGHALGVTYPPTLFLALAVVVVLIRLLVADMERCKMMLQQRRMNQHLARLGLRVRQMEKAAGVAGVGMAGMRVDGDARDSGNAAAAIDEDARNAAAVVSAAGAGAYAAAVVDEDARNAAAVVSAAGAAESETSSKGLS